MFPIGEVWLHSRYIFQLQQVAAQKLIKYSTTPKNKILERNEFMLTPPLYMARDVRK